VKAREEQAVRDTSPVSTLHPPSGGPVPQTVDLTGGVAAKPAQPTMDPLAMMAAFAAAMAGREDAEKVTHAEESTLVGCIDPVRGGFTGKMTPQVAALYLKMLAGSCPKNGQSPGSGLVEAAVTAVRGAGFRPAEETKQRAAAKRILALDTEGLLELTQDLLGTKAGWSAALVMDVQRAMSAIVHEVNVLGGSCLLRAFSCVEDVLRGPGGLASQDIDWVRVGGDIIPAQLKSVCNEMRRSLKKGEIPEPGAGVLCPEATQHMQTVLLLGGPTGKALEELAGLKRSAEEANLQQRGMGVGTHPRVMGAATAALRCFNCGEGGHKRDSCPKMEKGKGKGGKGGAGKGDGKGKGARTMGKIADLTDVCSDFKKGECPRGEACTQTHVTAVCHAFKEGRTCKFGPECKFRHFLEGQVP
jgi:hypothetical protein